MTNAITGDEATAAGQTATIVASEVTAKLVDKAVLGPNPDVSPMVKDLITTTRKVTKNAVTNTAKKINED